MKKRIVLAFCLCFLCLGLIGCQDNKKQDVSINDMIFSITNNYAIPSPLFLNKEDVAELIKEETFPVGDFEIFSEKDILEAAGVKSGLDISSDIVLAIKTDDEKINRAEELLNFVKSNYEEKFRDYVPSQYEKAIKGDVFTIDDYVFLIIIGNPNDETQGFEEEINKKFF